MKFSARNIIDRRDKLGMTQEDLVFEFRKKGMDISVRTICNWETGKSHPDAKDFELLCDILNKPVSYFFVS